MSKKQKCFYSRPYGFHRVDIRQTGIPELDYWNGSTNKPTRAEDYNMAKLLSRKPGDPVEMPEYIGPVEICHLAGRGRGVTATQDISPGQLLIVSKALAIVHPNPDLDTSSRLVQDVRKMGELRTAVVELLQRNTAASKLVYQLHSGPKLGVMEPNQAEASIGTIDMERIERICALNGFESSYQTESKGSSYGLWFLPSFLNHDCSGSNAHWTVFQNYMFIRATKRVLKARKIIASLGDFH